MELALVPPSILSEILSYVSYSAVLFAKTGDKRLIQSLQRGGCSVLVLNDPKIGSKSRWPMFINSGLKLRTLEVCRAGTIATNDIITRSCVKALPKTLRRLVFDFKNALFVITPAAPIARFGDSSPVNRFIDLASLLPDLEELIIRQPARDKTYAHYIVESSSLALLPASLRLLCALDISLEDEKMDLASLLPTSLTSLEMLVDPTKVSSWPPQLTFLRPVGEELDSISAPNETWPKLPSSLKSLKCSHQAYRDGSALALPLLTELSILRTSNPLVWVKGSFPSNLTDLRLMDSDSYFDFDLAILPRTLTRLELTLDWQALERSVKLANPFPASLSQVAVPNASADEAGSEAIDPADLHLMDLRKRGELDLSFWPPALRLLKSVGFSTSSDLSKTVQFYLIPPTIEDLSVKATLNEDILLDPLLLFPSLAAFSFFAYSAYSLSLAPSFGQLRSLRRLVLSSSTKLPEHFPDSLKHLQLSYNAAQVIPRLQASGGLPVGIESIQADFTSSWGWGMSPLVSESLFTHWPATLTSIRFQQSMLLRSIVVMPPSLIELHCKDTIIHDPSTQVEPSYIYDVISDLNLFLTKVAVRFRCFTNTSPAASLNALKPVWSASPAFAELCYFSSGWAEVMGSEYEHLSQRAETCPDPRTILP